ncbi:hypothetical protein [Lacihabitans lacunae]|jgi:hypothetical protein|uniref:Transcriptional regulator n=1 Tax=Lacihabitans lacunae TaxID=1028214 RepID=A0ABV7Z0S4_9BACT
MMHQTRVFVPAEYIEQVMEVSKGVFNNEEEVGFLKSCLYYLKEGLNADQAIDMAMIDYLIDL